MLAPLPGGSFSGGTWYAESYIAVLCTSAATLLLYGTLTVFYSLLTSPTS
jgi:hypothetical protein